MKRIVLITVLLSVLAGIWLIIPKNPDVSKQSVTKSNPVMVSHHSKTEFQQLEKTTADQESLAVSKLLAEGDNDILKKENNPQKMVEAVVPARGEVFGYIDKVNNVFNTFILGGYYLNSEPNAQVAAQQLNGQIVNPNATFSFNKTLGQRTRDKGYVNGKSIVGGKFTTELAGGICRTSTALFNAVSQAGLPVAESHRHSLPIRYASRGNDAAVYYGALDLKFVNNLPYPVQIVIKTANGQLYVAIKEIGGDSETNYVPYVAPNINQVQQPTPYTEPAATPIPDQTTPQVSEVVLAY